MDIAWIRAFAAVVQYGSFSEAAEQLFLAQSIISKQVQRMEKELDTVLLDRSHRTVRLTRAGQRVYPEAQKLLEQYDGILHAARDPLSLHIAVTPVADCYGFSACMAQFAAAHPHIRFAQQESSNTAVLALLFDGGCDGAFCRLPEGEVPPPQSVEFCSEELVLMTRKCAGTVPQPVSLTRFAQEPFLLLDVGTGLYDASLSLCQKAGFQPKIHYIGASAGNIRQLVLQGSGNALLTEHVAAHSLCTGLEIVHIVPTLHSRVCFIPAAEAAKNPAMKAFLAWLRETPKP